MIEIFYNFIEKYMNKCILKGNVGQDPRITDFQNGGKVAQFTLATTERGFTTKDGREIPEETTWHNIVVKNSGLAKVCQQYVKKGTPLLIEGKIKTRQYEDNSGQTRYVTEIVVDEMELLGSKKPEQAPAPEPDYRPTGGYQPIADGDLPDGI